MAELGRLLRRGDEGVPKDVVRAKQLLERAVNRCSIIAMSELGSLLHHGDESTPKDIVRARQLCEHAAVAGDLVGMFHLGLFLESGEAGLLKDVMRARQFYQLGANRGYAPARRALARLLEAESSSLATAFCCALSSPEVLDLAFLANHIRTVHVASALDLLAGHNLVLLSIRTGMLNSSNIATVGNTARYFQENLYQPATILNTGNDELIDSVFVHAESIGLVEDGFTLKARETGADIKKGDKVTSRVVENLAYCAWVVEQKVSKVASDGSWVGSSVDSLHSELGHLSSNQQTMEGAAVHLSNSLRQLRSVCQERDGCSKYARLTQCVLSFVAVMCAAVGGTTDVFGHLTAADYTEIGIDIPQHMISKLVSVDLDNFQVARLIVSDKVVTKMSPVVANALQSAVNECDIVSVHALESMIVEEIEAAGRENPSIASLDVASSSWMNLI